MFTHARYEYRLVASRPDCSGLHMHDRACIGTSCLYKLDTPSSLWAHVNADALLHMHVLCVPMMSYLI